METIKQQREQKLQQKQKMRSYYARSVTQGKNAVSTSKSSVVKQQVTQPATFKLSSTLVPEGRRKDLGQLLKQEKLSTKATG